MACECKVVYNKSIRDRSENFTPEAKELVEELHYKLFHTEDDLNYHQAILDGSWPSSVEQLTEALEKAKTIKAEREKE